MTGDRWLGIEDPYRVFRMKPLWSFAAVAALALTPAGAQAAPADSATSRTSATPAATTAKPAAKPAPASAKSAAGSGAAAATPDVSGYQELLNELLTVISAPGEPLDTRFDYEKFYDMRGRFERCKRIRRQMLAVPPSAMDERTRLAWAINTYNYLVIETATEYLLVPERGRLRYMGPRDIKTPMGPFFQAPLVEIEGKKYSLDQFELHFLFADFERAKGGPPPASLDPRVHFALVCGAIGCPPLQPRAYRADSLKIQLESATRNALAMPRHLVFLEASGRVQASSIFQWYSRDFGGMEKAFDFVLNYAPAKTRAAIEQRKIKSISGMTVWDWNLNQTVRKKEI